MVKDYTKDPLLVESDFEGFSNFLTGPAAISKSSCSANTSFCNKGGKQVEQPEIVQCHSFPVALTSK